jgi:hypothetical protein
MGLDASVMCNCYKQGKAKPCPFPDHFIIDDEGYPVLDLPYDDNEHMFDDFETWLATCCDHPHMDYAAVFVANWKGYRSFLNALEQVGWHHFPVLHAELPEGNQGITLPDAARSALAEIARFRSESNSITKTFLVNSETSESLGSSTMAYGGLFTLDGRTGLNLSFDETGFVITDTWELNRELFRAMRFEQRPLESDSLDKPQQFEYIDLDGGARYTCSTPVKLFVRGAMGQLRQEYPRFLHVEQRPIAADYFDYILEPLEYAFQAALETGNPVRWS